MKSRGINKSPSCPESIGAPLKKPSVRRELDNRFGLNLLLDLIQWLHDLEAGRSSCGSCERLHGAAGRAQGVGG